MQKFLYSCAILLIALLFFSCMSDENNPAQTLQDADTMQSEFSFQSGMLMANITEDPLGSVLTYPEGTPAVSTSMAVWEPGFESGWHYHPYFGAAYILKGELTVSFDENTSVDRPGTEKTVTRTETYKAGDAFLGTPNTWHYSSNQGDVELVFMVSWIGEDGMPIRVDE